MCKLNEPYITKCGHTFCKVSVFLLIRQVCISECVNRQHECPECRAKLTKDDMFRNFSLETLLEKLNEERDKEQHRYFANLAGNAGLDQPKNNPHQQHADKSPIETVFALNLRESLLSY